MSRPRAATLAVWFYDPAADREGAVNKLVARVDGPFCHCELQFADGEAASILMYGQACMRPRRFTSANYQCVRVSCTRAQHDAAREVCRRLAGAGVPFSRLRMLNAYMRVGARATPVTAAGAEGRVEQAVGACASGTFCSELVALALQAGGLLPGAVPAHVSPSELARRLEAAATAPRESSGTTAFGACRRELRVGGFL